MRSFELFLDVMGDWIEVSSSHMEIANFTPYNEKLDELEHNQYTFTFSVVSKTYTDNAAVWNPLLSYYFIGARLLLIIDNRQYINLIIKNVSPDSSTLSTVYNITAQDEVSYLWAKHNVGYNYSTLNREHTNTILTPRNIFQIAKDVLIDNFLNDWTVTSQSLDAELENNKIILEITNSNPYNVIIEACNTVNASLVVNYRTKRLDFYRKDLQNFSGYRYRPDYNIIQYNANYSGEQMATMLHVHGGTDANEVQISMIPSMPDAIRRYFYYKNKLEHPGITEIQWNEILTNNFSWEDIENTVRPGALIPQGYTQAVPSLSSNNLTNFINSIIIKLENFHHIVTISNGGHRNGWHITAVFTDQNKLVIAFALGLQTELMLKIPYIIDNGSLIYDKPNIIDSFNQTVTYNQLILYSPYGEVTSSSVSIQSITLPYNEIEATPIDNLTYYSQPSKAFLPIYQYSIKETENDNIQTVIINDGITYNIKFNNITGEYEGIIHFSTDDNSYNIIFPLEVENWSLDSQNKKTINENINKFDEHMNLLGPVYQLTLYYNSDDINNLISSSQKTQEEQIQHFLAVANKVPYLGQSLIDVQLFRPYLNDQQWTRLDTLINYTWRNLNIQLQYYAPEYHSAVYDLIQLRNRFITYGELYTAACVNYENEYSNTNDDSNQDKLSKLKEDIDKAKNNLRSVIQNSRYFELLDTIGYSKELDIDGPNPATLFFTHEKEKYQKNITAYNEEIAMLSGTTTDDSYLSTEAQSRKQYYQQLIRTANTLCENFAFTIDNLVVRGMYDEIIYCINDIGEALDISDGIANKYHMLQQQVQNNVMRVLYSNYGQFIYEQTYENAEELDSSSLFNQAYAHFVNINRIQSNHTLESVDIGELECINIPRLSVGSIIEVQNKNSIQAQPYAFVLSQIEKEENLCQYYLSINDNEKYEQSKQKLDDKRVTLLTLYNAQHDKTIDTYTELINTLYADYIQVTGISRVLREPLKDSVTVEQPSQYKSILAKLIKSI